MERQENSSSLGKRGCDETISLYLNITVDALLYYGILEPTWRIRVGTNGGKGRVIIFILIFQQMN